MREPQNSNNEYTKIKLISGTVRWSIYFYQKYIVQDVDDEVSTGCD